MERTLPLTMPSQRVEATTCTAASVAVDVADLSVAFDGMRVLESLEFSLPAGAVLLIQGPNGCGKTTLLNVLSGFVRPERGRVSLFLHGRRYDAWTAGPETLARGGLGRLWQDVRLFPNLSVLDNVLAADQGLLGVNSAAALALWPMVQRRERAARERAMHHLEIVGLADRHRSTGGFLSLGQMKRVALARLLQGGASVLLLDEPLAGLDDEGSAHFADILGRLSHREGRSLVVVEHQRDRILPICDLTLELRTPGADGRRGQ